MAVLEYSITGDNSGLLSATNGAIANIENLTKSINNANVSLQFKNGIAALDNLSQKLLVVQGNATLFGDGVANQTQQISAYQSAINSLLSNGYDPMDADVQRLKAHIDELNASIKSTPQRGASTQEFNDNSGHSAGIEYLTSNPSVKAPGIQELNAQLAAGTINAQEYAQALAGANSTANTLGQTTRQTSQAIIQEEGYILGLKQTLQQLNAQKLNAPYQNLSALNSEIQQTEIAITQATNMGRVGFDSLGNSIKSTTQSTSRLGGGLSGSFGYLRQIAYILPGIGIAGIFNLAFEGIAKAANELGVFNSRLTVAESNLNNLNEVSKNASKQYGEQATNLRILYAAATDVNNSQNDRLLAVRELQKEFPDYFKNISTEKILNGESSGIYKQLTVDILENAKAKAAATKISQLAAKQLDADFEKQKIYSARQSELSKVSERVVQRGVGANSDQLFTTSKSVLEKQAKDEINKRADLARNVQDQNKKDLQQQIDFLIAFAGGNNKIAKALSTGNTPTDKNTENTFEALKKQLDDVLAKSDHLSDQSGLTGYALQVQKITDKYFDLNRQLDEVVRKAGVDLKGGKITTSQFGILTSTASTDRSQLEKDSSKQLKDAKIKDAQNTADAITKINNDFGVKQASGYNEELSKIKRLYDGIISAATEGTQTLAQIEENYQNAITKANGNNRALDAARANYDAQIQQANDAQAKILAAKADLLPAIQAIDEKYIQQEQQTYDKIVDIANQALTALDDGEASRTDKINSEWQKRIASANAYFDKLRNLAVSSKLPQSSIDNINSVQAQVNSVLSAANFKKVSEEISKNFAGAMQSSVQGFVSNFYTSITSLGTARQSIDEKYATQLANAQDQATRDQINRIKELEKQSTTSFGAIFSDLVSKFNSTFNQSIIQGFTKQFTENLGKTLLAPTASQLTISPEEQSAQQVSTLLKSAGSSLADQIRQAGLDFYNTTKGGAVDGLLSGASGGSSLVPGLTANQGLGSFAPNADGTVAFGETVASSSTLLGDTFKTSATATTDAANESANLTKGAANHLSTKIAAAAAGLSLAGGLVSGATSPTSKVGQGVGGLLQGAGQGAIIGSVIPGIGTVAGAAIGGAIGLISGIFSASKAQKELQAQQLAEQQQQTALLKASLAYTSSIIGRDTANGIVTGVSVGAFGQLTATVSGKDLQFVLDRNANGR